MYWHRKTFLKISNEFFIKKLIFSSLTVMSLDEDQYEDGKRGARMKASR